MPEDTRRRATEIDWRKIAGMRDVLAHTYFEVDLDIVRMRLNFKLGQ